MVEGGCFCGAVRYRAEGAVTHETLCHCTLCRRTSGAPCVAWFTVPAAGLRFTAGEPARFASSDHGTRGFCRECGTSLSFASSRSPDEIDLTTASLDDPERLPPADHTFARSKLSWLVLGDGLPAYPAARP